MPFITEELWDETGSVGPARQTMLIEAPWPTLSGLVDAEVDAEIAWIIDLVTAIRSVRAEMSIPPSAKMPLFMIAPDAKMRERMARHETLILRLARLSSLDAADAPPAGSLQIVSAGTVAALPIADVIDISAERARLQKDIKKLDDEIGKIDKKLGNEAFLAKAPDAVVEEQRDRRADAEARRGKILESLDRIASVS